MEVYSSRGQTMKTDLISGVVINGTMYDIGNPSSYHASFDNFN